MEASKWELPYGGLHVGAPMLRPPYGRPNSEASIWKPPPGTLRVGAPLRRLPSGSSHVDASMLELPYGAFIWELPHGGLQMATSPQNLHPKASDPFPGTCQCRHKHGNLSMRLELAGAAKTNTATNTGRKSSKT